MTPPGPYRPLLSVLYTALLLLGLWTPFPLYAQPYRPVENIALLDSLAGMYATAFLRDVPVGDLPALRLMFSQHPAAERLRHVFYRRAGLPVPPQETGATSAATYYIADFGIRYFAHTDDDSLVREASLALLGSTAAPSHTLLPDYRLALRDTIARSDLPFVESRQFEFARAVAPEPQADFYTTVAEPLIVVSAAVITLLLLFTVRSQ